MGNMMSVGQTNPAPPNIVPVRIRQTSRTNTYLTNPPDGAWGHKTLYGLQVMDNRTPSQPYPNGTVRERFFNYSSNQTYSTDLAGQYAPGSSGESGTDAQGNFFDKNYWNNYGWSPAHFNDTGFSTFWFSFDQVWDVYRKSDAHPFPGVDTHHITHFQGFVTRNGAE